VVTEKNFALSRKFSSNGRMKTQRKVIPAFFAGFFFLGASVGAQPDSSVKGEILEFGLYKSVGGTTTTNTPDTPNETRTTSKKVEFTERTEKIPRAKGVSFGIRYKVTGLTEASVELKKVVKHPPFKNKKGEMETEYSLPLTKKVNNGSVVSVEGYSLGDNAQSPAGAWTFEIWYHDQKLVSQSFDVVPPEQAKKK
jgi:hypothetical protein